MGIQACPIPWSHCGVPANAVPSCTWLYIMHYTHQPYKQIWAHPLPNGHPLWQSEEGQLHLKPENKYNKRNVRINILDESYFYTMKVLQKPSLEICIE
jgi:hypothetical protein